MKPFFESAGDLAALDVLSALCAVGRGGASGEARFTGPGGDAVRYAFDQGVLVLVETPPADAPAEMLIRAGKIQRATYEALTVGDFEDRFAVAVASGVISRREAGWGIKIAAIETLARIAASPEGTYTFAEGPAEPMQPPFRLPVDHWILELFLRSGDRPFVLRRIGATDIPIARVEGFAEGFAALGLTADADAVVEGIDGERTIEKIVRRSRADEFATLKLLAALMTLGLIHPILEAPLSSAPPASSAEGPVPPEPAPADDPEADAGLSPFPAEDEPFGDAGESAAEAPARSPEGERRGGPEESTLALPIPGDLEDDGGFEERDLAVDPMASFSGVPDDAGPAEPPFPPSSPAAIRDASPVVELPLFALTAPEEPASEPILERPGEESPAIAGPPGARRRWMIVGLVAAALVAAFLLVRRPRPPASTPPPAAAPTVPAPPPARPPARAAPKESPRASSPSDIVVSPAPAPRTAPPRSSKGEPASTGAEGRWASLAESGRREMEHPGRHRYAIQLELACEDATLQKAFASDPGRRRLWIAPYAFRGRPCYRVLWGKFDDLASARAAKSAVPGIFAREGNRPTVVPLGRPAAGGRPRR